MCDTVRMCIKPLSREPIWQEIPAGFHLADVEVRLVDPSERLLWDDLMDTHHYLGFRRFAGRGLRYAATWKGRWLALAGWQGGAFKCRPRDLWIGWKPAQHFDRLGMIVNNTRFLVLAAPGVFPNLASFFLAGMTRRIADDWLSTYGHRVLIAETFCDPARFPGTMYKAAGWQALGMTRGFARCNGKYTDPHDEPKLILVRSLQRDAHQLLARPEPLPLSVMPPVGHELAPRDPEVMRSLHDELAAVPDYRRAQGRKHTVACVLSVHILATMANMRGCLAAAQFARALSQEQLAAIGAWKNPKTGLHEPVAKSTLHRVVQSLDPEALEDVLHRWSRPRLSLARAIAADGKRIRGANRNGDGHHETVTLVDHVTGAPFAILGYNDDGGEIAALNDLLLRCDIRGRIITVDALHTARETARLITERCGADYVLNVKGNASETFALLDSIDWERDRDRAHVGESEKQHGRIEQRSIDVLAPLKGMVNFPGVRQIARVTRYREVLEDGKEPGNETVYLITSLDSATASAADLLALNRGHWEVENNNHRQRDCNFGEDACLTHTGNGPLNRACLNTIALAVIFATRRKGAGVIETMRRFALDRDDAIRVVCEPTPAPEA